MAVTVLGGDCGVYGQLTAVAHVSTFFDGVAQARFADLVAFFAAFSPCLFGAA